MYCTENDKVGVQVLHCQQISGKKKKTQTNNALVFLSSSCPQSEALMFLLNLLNL